MGLFKRTDRKAPESVRPWFVRLAGPDGRIIKKCTDTTNKKLARDIEANLRREIAEGRHLNKKKELKTTFYQLCNEYWKTEGCNKGWKGLESTVNLMKKRIGNVPLKEIKPRTITKFLNNRMTLDGISPSMWNQNRTVLCFIFNWGISNDLALENTAKGKRRNDPKKGGLAKLRENGARTRYLEASDMERVLSAARLEADDAYPVIVFTALNTGMKKGEIFGLKWSDVNFKNKIITVRNSKNGQQRFIPIDDELYQELQDLASRSKGLVFKKGLVFPSR